LLIYLPIAELPLNIFLILGMGAAVGFLSGLFGVGGGFLLTPLLVFSGVTPPVAVATVTSQIVASSASGVLVYWRRKTIDWKLASYLMVSGIIGTGIGVWVFRILRAIGQLDLFIGLSYVVLLGTIGLLMVIDSVRAFLAQRRPQPAAVLPRPRHQGWIHTLPLKVRFAKSRLYLSVIPIIGLGVIIGFFGTLLGIGGGFIMVPAMIYLLKVPTNVVIGTSLVQILATMAAATVFHAVTNQTVDAVLGLILMVGGVVGAQFGAQVGTRMRGEQLRALLGILILSVGIRFAIDLAVEPQERYSLTVTRMEEMHRGEVP
jgi:uncharacterized membrane protein YfcA